DVEGMTATRIYLGRDALANDELEQAAAVSEECLVIIRDTHHDWELSLVTMIQAEIERRQGNYDEALRLLSEVMAWRQKLGNRDFVAAVLDGQGRIARSQGSYAAANALHR